MSQENPLVSLYATQGGGYATLRDGQYVWHSEIPSFVNAIPGDPVPEEWGIRPANEAAHEEVERQQEAAWDEHEFGTGFCNFCGTRGCRYCFRARAK